MKWTTRSKEKQRALVSSAALLTEKIEELAPSCDFDVLEFYKKNKPLVKKFIKKNTLKLKIDDFDLDKVPANWWYNNKEGLLKAKIKNKPFSTYQKLEWIKCGLMISYFTRKYVKIISIDEGVIPFDLYDYQEELLDMFADNRFIISLQARQSGKCAKVDTRINIRNSKTNEIRNITMGEFHELTKKENKTG